MGKTAGKSQNETERGQRTEANILPSYPSADGYSPALEVGQTEESLASKQMPASKTKARVGVWVDCCRGRLPTWKIANAICSFQTWKSGNPFALGVAFATGFLPEAKGGRKNGQLASRHPC